MDQEQCLKKEIHLKLEHKTFETNGVIKLILILKPVDISFQHTKILQGLLHSKICCKETKFMLQAQTKSDQGYKQKWLHFDSNQYF